MIDRRYYYLKDRGLKPVVDHIDNNPYNNMPNNLRWLSHSDNIKVSKYQPRYNKFKTR